MNYNIIYAKNRQTCLYLSARAHPHTPTHTHTHARARARAHARTHTAQHNTAQHNTHTHTQEYCDSSRKTHSTFHNILSVFHFKFHVESAPTRSVSAALRWLRDSAKVESEGLAPLSYDAMADETCQNCTTVA